MQDPGAIDASGSSPADLLLLLAEHVDIVLYVYEPREPRVVYVSPAFEKVWGRTCSEVYADPACFLAAIDEDQRASVAARWETRTDGQSTRKEYGIHRPDGTVAWLSDQCFPVLDASGHIRCVVGTATEITHQKQAEHRLAEKERLLDLALRVARLGVWDWDLRSGITTYDARSAAMLGYERLQMVPSHDPWSERIQPDDLVEARRIVGMHLLGQTDHYEINYRIRDRDDRWKWIQSSGGTVERDASGTPLRVVGIHADITARKEAEMELSASAELLRLAENFAGIGHLIRNLHDGSWRWSEEAFRILGYGPGEVLPSTDAFLSRAGQADLASLCEFLEGGPSPEQKEVRLVAWDGRSPVLVLRRGSIVESVELEPRALFTIQDVTEARKAEEAFRSRERLDALSHLTSGVAHNFNNLLGILLATFEQASRLVEGGSDLAALLEVGRGAVLSGADLVKSMSAAAEGRPAKAVEVELDSQLRSIAKLLESSLPASTSVRLSLLGEPMNVRVDRGAFDSAIVNIVANARDAIRGSGEIRISTRREAVDAFPGPAVPDGLLPGLYGVVEVADDGEGMDRLTLARAFDPFFTTKGLAGGKGLGLAITRGFCRSVGGDIAVRSVEGEGTTVSLFLPLVAAVLNAGAGRVERVPSSGALTGRILVVEDESALRDLACSVLETAGHSAIGVASVEAAIEALAGGSFDAVVSDVILGTGASGHELVAWLGTQAPGIPVVLTSGIPLDAGADPRILFLAKPYRIARLLEVVGEALLQSPGQPRAGG